MIPVLLCLLATACYATSNVFDARITTHILKRLPTVLFYAGLTDVLIISLIVLSYGLPHAMPAELMPYLLLCGFLNCFYLVPYYAALKTTDTSIVSALFSPGEILVPVLAFFILGDKLSALQYAGFFLVIFASIALNVNDLRHFKINAGFWIMLLSAAMNSTASVFYKKLLNGTDAETVMLWVMATSLCFSSAMILIPAFAKDIVARAVDVKQNWTVFFFMVIASVTAFGAKTFAMNQMSVVAYRALSATQPLFVLGYGAAAAVFFGKKLQEQTDSRDIAKKIVCFVLIICGIILTMNAPL